MYIDIPLYIQGLFCSSCVRVFGHRGISKCRDTTVAGRRRQCTSAERGEKVSCVCPKKRFRCWDTQLQTWSRRNTSRRVGGCCVSRESPQSEIKKREELCEETSTCVFKICQGVQPRPAWQARINSMSICPRTLTSMAASGFAQRSAGHWSGACACVHTTSENFSRYRQVLGPVVMFSLRVVVGHPLTMRVKRCPGVAHSKTAR